MNDATVTITGNVTNEPTLRVTNGGQKVTSFGLACTERLSDGNGGWRDGETTFARVSCWRGMAENVVDSIAKGQPVFVHGRVRAHSWEDAKGNHHPELDITAKAVGHDLNRGVSSFRKAKAADRQSENGLPAPDRSPVGPAPDVWATPLMPPDDAADTGDIGDVEVAAGATDIPDIQADERTAGAA
jgi:single-strand DNA-binding protein